MSRLLIKCPVAFDAYNIFLIDKDVWGEIETVYTSEEPIFGFLNDFEGNEIEVNLTDIVMDVIILKEDPDEEFLSAFKDVLCDSIYDVLCQTPGTNLKVFVDYTLRQGLIDQELALDPIVMLSVNRYLFKGDKNGEEVEVVVSKNEDDETVFDLDLGGELSTYVGEDKLDEILDQIDALETFVDEEEIVDNNNNDEEQEQLVDNILDKLNVE